MKKVTIDIEVEVQAECDHVLAPLMVNGFAFSKAVQELIGVFAPKAEVVNVFAATIRGDTDEETGE